MDGFIFVDGGRGGGNDGMVMLFVVIMALVFGIGGLVLANDMTKNMTDMSIQHSEEVASQEEEEAKHWNEAIEESYSFYVDGSEVDPDNIDRNQYYEITFDDDAYKVFLSN